MIFLFQIVGKVPGFLVFPGNVHVLFIVPFEQNKSERKQIILLIKRCLLQFWVVLLCCLMSLSKITKEECPQLSKNCLWKKITYIKTPLAPYTLVLLKTGIGIVCIYLKDKEKLHQLQKRNQKGIGHEHVRKQCEGVWATEDKSEEDQTRRCLDIDNETCSGVKGYLPEINISIYQCILKKSNFVSDEEKETVKAIVLEEFKDELVSILIEQIMSPDSPLFPR